MDAWLEITDATERRRRVSADLDSFLNKLDESWRVRFSIGLTNALIDKLCEQSTLDLLIQLRTQQYQMESFENNARMELLKSLQLDPQIDSKMCQNDSDILTKVDKVVENQQLSLQQLGLPGFRVTQNRREQELQCKILEFIHSPMSI